MNSSKAKSTTAAFANYGASITSPSALGGGNPKRLVDIKRSNVSLVTDPQVFEPSNVAMRILFLLTLAVTLSFLVDVTAKAVPPVTTNTAPPRKKMKPFGSERELHRYFREIAERAREARRYRTTETVQVSASVDEASLTESVTNTQHAGVDEGGIVKVHGDHLVILRRGRLFTVAIGNGALQPVSSLDAFGPEIDPEHSWYDEMLVSGDTVVVIGYSYERGGTEIGLFNIAAAGQLSYRSTYHLRSNDYYSSRNYASRLIGTKLIFYTPLYFDVDKEDPFESFPAVRRWHKGATNEEFRRIVSANRVYRPQAELHVAEGLTLHTVTTCDLAYGGFNCAATTVVGPEGRVFYASPESIYVWATDPWPVINRQAMLFRMPLDGSAPTALRVSGGPTDQFSFLQSDDQYLNVLVRADSKGDGMWAAEVAEDDVALMRIPLWSFSDGSETVPASSYKRLPRPIGYAFQNRFVHNYLLYGTGYGWDYGEDANPNDQKQVYLVDWASGEWRRMELSHGVDRIEQMGADAIVIGGDGRDLHFTAISLGQQPEIFSRYMLKDVSQGETRSHGFFYKPDGNDSGTLGLPLRLPGRLGYLHLFESSSAIVFLRNDAHEFRELGELGAQSEKAVDDKCRASCIDWYGNSRPLFLRNRVFALLGYELVEGKIDNGRLREVRRINYAPK
jgi:Beta propeller domain